MFSKSTIIHDVRSLIFIIIEWELREAEDKLRSQEAEAQRKKRVAEDEKRRQRDEKRRSEGKCIYDKNIN